MPTQPFQFFGPIRRLLWWLVGGLLLLGIISTVISSLLLSNIETRLQQRGLDAQIDYLQVSLPRLSVQINGIKIRNPSGRGFQARELMLDYSWWQLMRGRVQLQRVYLRDAHMDLQSYLDNGRRRWEIGGWALGRGGSAKRDLKILLEHVRILDSSLCYRHRPQWHSPGCVQFDDLNARDFLIGVRRQPGNPLQLEIGADKLLLRDLLARDEAMAHANTALVSLKLSKGRFVRPGNQIAAEKLSVRQFGSCPPQRWVDALPALRRLIGHCATAQSLQLDGDLQFSFGASAQVQWHRARGRDIQLRHHHRRWPNWRAQDLAVNDFQFIRSERRLSWQTAGAGTLDWCPPPWRNHNQHYCLRAGILQLPTPATFDWRERLKVDTAGARLQQVQLLDMGSGNRKPITVNQARLGPVSYRGEERNLEFGGLELDSARGCIPGQLWQLDEYCVRVVGLRLPDLLRVQFASTRKQLSWGFASGLLQLEQFAVKRGDEPQLQLRKLHWQGVNFPRGNAPSVVRDLGLQSLRGCVPDALLPQALHPLCAELENLSARGNFALQRGADGYLIWGDMKLQRMLLADQPDSLRGLLLKQLHIGSGYLRGDRLRKTIWVNDGQGGGEAAGKVPDDQQISDEQQGVEKGRLAHELAQQKPQSETKTNSKGEVQRLEEPNLQLQELSLTELHGCLSDSWARLLYGGREQMPHCINLRNLHQRRPLKIAWQGGLDLQAEELTLERSRVRTSTGKELVHIEGLHLPRVRIRHGKADQSWQLSLPGFASEYLSVCRPDQPESPAVGMVCANIEQVRLGEDFLLQINNEKLSANFNHSAVRRLQAIGTQQRPVADVQELLVPKLEIQWPRDSGKVASLRMKDISVAKLDACLPEQVSLRAGLPRCISSDDLRTVKRNGGSGLALGEIRFGMTPQAQPLWSIEAVEVAKVSLTPEALELTGMEIRHLLACGLFSLLPAARDAGMADCISTGRLKFAGVNRIGLTPAVALLELGILESTPIELRQEEMEFVPLSLQRLSWNALRWRGGPFVSVTDLAIQNFGGCLQAARGTGESCIRLREVHLGGAQKLSLAAPFSTNGAIELMGLSFGSGSGKPFELARVTLEQPSYGGEGPAIGRLSGAFGCLSGDWFNDTRSAPCYRLGPVQFRALERIGAVGARETLLRDLSIDSLQLRHADFPASTKAQLLELESLHVNSFRFGAGRLAVEALAVESVAGCVPRGYLRSLRHCYALEVLNASGSYSLRNGLLTLEKIQTQQLQLADGEGRGLVRIGSMDVPQVFFDRDQVQVAALEFSNIGILGRHEDEPEFERHTWNGEMQQLRIERLSYSAGQRNLVIGAIKINRPKGILSRNREGEFPVRKHFTALTGESNERPVLAKVGDALTYELKFHYRIGEVYIDHGYFTWVDQVDQYRGRLPVRNINIFLHNLSNYPQDPPASLLLNARPGGLGELHLAGEIDYQDTQKWDADLAGYIVNANLIPATPYMANLLGYKILQGQLDAELDIRIRENKVDTRANMVLNKIKMRRVRESFLLPVEKTLIPLDIALLLLKDGKGNVQFSMPITGDLYDPNFSFSFIFSDLLQRAIMEALFSYFTPVGFYTLGRLAWARFKAVDFDPIEFSPGSVELDAKAEKQLTEMAATLKERPDTRPGICGVANANDWHAMYPATTPAMRGSRKARETFYRHPPPKILEEMEQLAQRRSQRVERFLLESGISAGEFIQCAPDYNGRDFEEPRVELSN